ncbi:MAG TPA: hypothetical protein VEV81_09590, partial [Pyrinomonadaceae bacterium]|nr:hypothetical protein [Pyrinomonadaceae bacterium]
MDDALTKKAERLREAFNLTPHAQLLAPEAKEPVLPAPMVEQLSRFNIEWHIIPSNESVPMDDVYMARFYPMAQRGFTQPREHAASYRDVLIKGHRKHQGQIIGVETT